MAKTEALKVVNKEEKSTVKSTERIQYEILGNYSRLQTAVDKIKIRKIVKPVHERQSSQCCQMMANLLILLTSILLVKYVHKPAMAYHSYHRFEAVLGKKFEDV